jgi:hypothetical protein
MRATIRCLGALFVAAATASAASAWDSCFPLPCGPWYGYEPHGVAPDACRYPGSYCTNAYGGVYGPNYNIYPPFAPWQGLLPAPNPNGGFPSHPYVRSPRDYFMYENR